MKKGRIALLVLSLLMVSFMLVLGSCTGGGGDDADQATTTAQATTTTTASASTEAAGRTTTDTVEGRDLSSIAGTEIFVFHQSFGPNLEQDMRDFEALYNVTIRAEMAPWDAYYPRLMALIMSGDSPDIYDGSDETLPMHAIRQIAIPIDGLYTAGAPWLDERVMEEMMFRGKTYFLAEQGRIPVMIFYNQTMFNRYGMETPMELYQRSEWTVDRMYEIAREFVADTSGMGEDDQFGYVGTSVYTIFAANQLPVASYNPATGQFTLELASDRQLAVLQQALERVEANDIHPFGWSGADLFMNGRLAMASAEYWFANSLFAMEDEWSVAPLPVGQFGEQGRGFIRPWGVSVATGATNAQGGVAFVEFQYERNLTRGTEAFNQGVWQGRGDALQAVVEANRNSFFTLHNGIPGFRNLADSITWELNSAGGRTASDIVNASLSALQQNINEFNAMEEGWVDPGTFENPGPVDFADGTLGYLTMPVSDNVTQTVVSDGIGGQPSLHIELAEAGWWPIFGTGADDLEVFGGQAYRVTFDFEIIRTDEGTAMFYTQVNPGADGWTELHTVEGDVGTFDMVVSAPNDLPGLYIAICNFGVLELLVANFNIELVE